MIPFLIMTNSKYTLSLVKKAKSSGGDKYKIHERTDKDCFIYVSQKYSRTMTDPSKTLFLTISNSNIELDMIEFNLKKKQEEVEIIVILQ